MKIKCIDRGANEHITVGKVYDVIKDSAHGYNIVSDTGEKFVYEKDLFEIVDDEVAHTTLPVVVAAPASSSIPPFDFTHYNSLAGLPGRQHS